MTTRERVDQLESELNVTELTVSFRKKTFQIYPWLKGRLFHKMITGQETMQSRNLKLYWKQFSSIFYGLHNIFRRYDMWVFSTSLERRLIDKRYFDKLFDFIGNKTGYKALIIELRLFNYYPYRKIASKYAMSRSFFLSFETIYARIFLNRVRVNNERLLKEICDFVPDGIDSKAIIKKYIAQYRMMRFWLRILPNPKLVLMSVSYTNFGYIMAFKEKGIKVVEVQHGIISKNHHAYFYTKEFDSCQFPDYLFTTGEKEVEVFDQENQFPVKKVFPIGSYLIDYWLAHSTHRMNSVPTVLFTLQDGVMGAKLIAFILKLKEELGESIQILVQPRRNGKDFYMEQFPALKDISFSENDFYSTATRVNIHSTVYSTTAIEALSLGIPNILINIDQQSTIQLSDSIGHNPFSITIEDVKEFMPALTKLTKIDRETIMRSNDQNIRAGYIQNVQAIIDEMMGK